MAAYKYTSKDIRRFWSKVAITANPDKCWEWLFGKNEYDYGTFALSKNNPQHSVLSHRVAWALTNGEIPDGLCVCHTCDNPSCVNPKHLFLGTHKANMEDKVKKGRSWKGGAPNGEGNGAHKLTAEQVKYIRERYAIGDISQRKLGVEMGVCQQLISHVVRGNIWKELM